MSISPQSLARTRDKRSLKTPARFEDFSEMPPEVTYRSVGEAVKAVVDGPTTGVIKASLAHKVIANGSKVKGASYYDKSNASSKPAPPPPTTSTTTTPVSNVATTTAPPTSSTTTTTTPSSAPPATTSSASTPTVTTQSKSAASPAPPASKSTATTVTPSSKSLTASTNNQSKGTTTTTNLAKGASSTTNTTTPATITTITTNTNSRGATTKSSGGSIRKKSKGHSLIANGPANKPFQCNTNINRAPTTVAQQALQQQQTRYITSNFNQGYGRLLSINEPVYLPCSVPPIAPITLSQQQLLNQSRRPPFISKTAEAYLTYQNDRQFSYLASYQKALVSIMRHLEVRDLLNMRTVNKTFKSLIDSDIIWKKVTVETSNIVDWQLFAERVLCKYKTTDLFLHKCSPNREIAESVGYSLEEASQNLRRITLTTMDAKQNRFALELICQLISRGRFTPKAVLTWNVRVVIDDYGIAQVNLLCRDAESLKDPKVYERNLYCYDVIDRLIGDYDEPVQVEMSELQDLFTGKHDKHSHPFQMSVGIKAI